MAKRIIGDALLHAVAERRRLAVVDRNLEVVDGVLEAVQKHALLRAEQREREKDRAVDHRRAGVQPAHSPFTTSSISCGR